MAFVVDKVALWAMRMAYANAKHRAKFGSGYTVNGDKAGRRKACNITLEYLLKLLKKQKGKCALTGVPLTYITARTIKEAGAVGNPKDFTHTNVSIDRINPKIGYVYGNVQLTTNYANKAKGEMSTEQFIALCAKVVKKHKA